MPKVGESVVLIAVECRQDEGVGIPRYSWARGCNSVEGDCT